MKNTLNISSKNCCLFIVLSSWLWLVSCDTLPSPAKSVMIKPTLVLADHESHYQYHSITDTKVEQTINDEKNVVENKIDVTTRYDFTSDTLKGLRLKVTYKEFKVRVHAGEIEKEVTASRASGSLDPQEKIFAAFDGAVVWVKLDSNGKIFQISGLEEIRKKMYELAGNSKEATDMIRNSLQNFLSYAYYKQNLEQTFFVFPSRRINVGDQWTANSSFMPDIKVPYSIHYRLKGIDEDKATIAIKGDLNLETQSIQIQQNSVQADLKGKQNGKISVDIKTGMVIDLETEFNAKGKMYYLMEVPVKLCTSTKIQGTRL